MKDLHIDLRTLQEAVATESNKCMLNPIIWIQMVLTGMLKLHVASPLSASVSASNIMFIPMQLHTNTLRYCKQQCKTTV